jgi:hypothetical protein
MGEDQVFSIWPCYVKRVKQGSNSIPTSITRLALLYALIYGCFILNLITKRLRAYKDFKGDMLILPIIL